MWLNVHGAKVIESITGCAFASHALQRRLAAPDDADQRDRPAAGGADAVRERRSAPTRRPAAPAPSPRCP